jgi:hypothetical protein
MAEAEQPERLDRRLSVADILHSAGATPHFALQLRGRIGRLIAPLPAGDPIRVYGVEQMALLELLAVRDEFRGEPPRPDLPPLPVPPAVSGPDVSASSLPVG